MDYLTKPTSRNDLRKMAKIVRKLFHVPQTGAFYPLYALEVLPDVIPGCTCEIVDDEKLSSKTMAQCEPNDDGTITIKIKKSVYDGAYFKNIGAYNGFITHEICHAFLYSVGFKPIMTMSFENGTIPRCRSMEWQAKALSGELMIPYEESQGMSRKQIMDTYHVSKGFADLRLKLDGK